MGTRIWAIVAAGVAALALSGIARAEDPLTREGYEAQVEPICKENTEANSHIFAGLRRGTAHRREVAGRRFIRAANAFGQATSQIAVVPPPPGYEIKLAKWVQHLRIIEANLRKFGKALKQGVQQRIVTAELKLRSSGNAANNVVYDFDFHYCKITSSRFR